MDGRRSAERPAGSRAHTRKGAESRVASRRARTPPPAGAAGPTSGGGRGGAALGRRPRPLRGLAAAPTAGSRAPRRRAVFLVCSGRCRLSPSPCAQIQSRRRAEGRVGAAVTRRGPAVRCHGGNKVDVPPPGAACCRGLPGFLCLAAVRAFHQQGTGKRLLRARHRTRFRAGEDDDCPRAHAFPVQAQSRAKSPGAVVAGRQALGPGGPA